MSNSKEVIGCCLFLRSSKNIYKSYKMNQSKKGKGLTKHTIQCLFQIQYQTAFGESLHLVIKKGIEQEVYDMQFGDDSKWLLNLELNRKEFPNDEIVYSYYFNGLHGDKKYEGGLWRKLNISYLKYEKISILDHWNVTGDIKNIYNTPVFHQPHPDKESKIKAFKLKESRTHIFTINVSSLPLNTKLCLLGNCATAGSWTISKKSFLSAGNENKYSLQMKLSPKDFPFEYKYALYDTVKNSLLQFEGGENRVIDKMDEAVPQLVHDGFANFWYEEKKRVGVSIPVFSLRSENSGGVGEFNDLKLMGAWAEKTGIQLIQILPVNDTTSSGSWEDSYPYSAISAFALHPMYLNLHTMAGNKFAQLAEKYSAVLKSYNELPDVNYPEVNRIKWNFFKEIFPIQKKQIFGSKKYREFFDKNKYWLEPYAVFCFLRDKNKTADFYTWKAYKKYSVASLNKLLKTKKDEISIYNYLQFHLHIQLLDAVLNLKKKGISLKGDLPIGIKRASADHWQNPELFNDDLLAGAPPDAFTEAGQNWGFPTYNWNAMKKNNYRWWEFKLNHSSTYAAAIRLDHVLGFFRIWSIPKENTQGILGYFQPAIALHENDFAQRNIYFNEERFCKPYITGKLVEEIFLEESGYVKDFFLQEKFPGYFEFKKAFNSQKKLQEFILKRDDSVQSKKLMNKLLYLHTEIILLKDMDNGFHFRVNMQHTSSFNALDEHMKNKLNALYNEYFFSRHNELWKKNGNEILSALHKTTNLLYCGEDLGWAPAFVPAVLKDNGILSLEVQRMPKKSDALFTDLSIVPYVCAATPGTHDMPVLREWWKHDENTTQLFYNEILKIPGKAPAEASGEIIKIILEQFLRSPAMWCIFQWQDLVAINEDLRSNDPANERINDPANAGNQWNYRMHISLENMLDQNTFNDEWKKMMEKYRRN